MPTNIDTLQIEINAKASKANDAIDRLVGKLDRLSVSLGRMNTTNLSSLANGVDRLGKAMQTMNTVKTADFTRLAKNMQQMGNINVVALQNASVAMSRLARGFSNLGGVSSNSYQVAEMAKSLGKLGGVNVQRAITNIPQLANAMRNLMATLSNAPRVSQNVIQMANAMANLASQGAKVGTASRSMQNGLNRTSTSADRARKSFGGLASVIGKFYASYFLVIRGLKGLWRSIESTTDYIEAFNYFNVALGKIGSDWAHQYEKYGYESADAYSESFKTRLQKKLKTLSGVSVEIDADGNGLLTDTGLKNLGLNIQEVTQYASQLASVTNSVGQTGEVSLATASAFSKLGADMSSLFNVDYSSVMNNLQSGLIGQSRALYKYGIDITNATLQTKAYQLGLTKAVSEMSQMEKQQLRVISILEQSKVSWGDLANTINSPSNMIRQFKNNLKETGMVLGQLFTPLLQKVMPVINGVAIAIKRLLINIAQLLGVKLNFEDFGQGYTKTEDSIEDLTDDYNDLTDAAKEYKNQAMSFDEINPIKEPDADSGKTSGAGAGIDLTDEILDATSEYEKAWQEAYDNMQTKAEKFANGISKALKPISTIFEDIAKGDWLKLGKDTSKLTTSIFNFFTKAIKKVKWKKIGENIGKFLKGVNWTEILKSIGELIYQALYSSLDLYAGVFSVAPIETAILTGIAGLKFAGLDKKITTALSSAMPAVITITVGVIAIKYAKDELQPVWDENSFEDIKAASEAMFEDWFGKNPLSLTLSDSFISLSSLIVDTEGVADAIALMWDDMIKGDFKFNLFNLIEFPSRNEMYKGMYDVWKDLVNSGFKYSILGLLEFPTPVQFANKLKTIWKDVKNGDFRFKLWGIFEMPSLNQIVNGLKKLWKDVKNGDFRFNLFGLFEFPSWNQMKSGIKQMWSNIKNGDYKWGLWGLFSLPTWSEMKAGIKKMWTSIKSGDFKFSFIELFKFPTVTELTNRFKSVWNGFAKWINDKLKIDVPAIEIAGKKVTSKTTIELGTVPTFATGGFPEDGWFRASKGEYFGQFDDGTSYISNNEQIENGIAKAVAPAIYNAVVSAMSMSSASGDTNVYIDGKQVFKAVRTQAKNYELQTGKPAFS